jgi:hypothetical protein
MAKAGEHNDGLGLRILNSTGTPDGSIEFLSQAATSRLIVAFSNQAEFTDTISMASLQQEFDSQRFANGYEFVNGVEMHKENGDNFCIPPAVIRRNVNSGQFVELRIDSPRFSVHDDSLEKCSCSSCHGEMTKPILRHENPESLIPLPEQNVPSRGWGEDFWVRVTEREDDHLKGIVDNSLAETRLHELKLGDEIIFHEDHILALHPTTRPQLLLSMDANDLKELAEWLGTQRE